MDSRTSLVRGALHVAVDPDVCIGAGNCVLWAAATFALGGNGVVGLRDGPEAGSDGVEAIIEAARNCPSGAIAVTTPDGSYPA